MFALWRTKTKIVTIAVNAVAGMLWSYIIYVAMGATNVAMSADSDDMRVISAVSSHVIQATSPAKGAAASSVPSVVATPLPPRKTNQIGKQCPIIALRPHSKLSSSEASVRAVKASVTKPPLPLSRIRVNSARSLFPVRRTLVAPILPDPILRMSP